MSPAVAVGVCRVLFPVFWFLIPRGSGCPGGGVGRSGDGGERLHLIHTLAPAGGG